MAYETIVTNRVGSIEHLTLNRPEVRNAFDEQMIAELIAWSTAIREDAARGTVRAAVLSGAGKVFSAGADVAWMAKTVNYSTEENLKDATAASVMFGALDGLPIPLIARIHGAAIGGGAGLAAVCDIVACDEQAIFGFTEVKLGIIPAVIAPFALAKIGRSAARELFVTGSRFGAARAREIGLVHAVTPRAELDGTIARYVEEILTAAPQAIAAAKELIARIWGRTIEDARPITANAIAARRVSREGQEGLRAFLEKRKASWTE